MGNCIACHSQPKKKTRVPLVEGRGLDVEASTPALAPVEKMKLDSSKHCIMVSRKLQEGEVYHLVPFKRQSVTVCGAHGKRKPTQLRNVKIVVTREQLELLLSGSKKLQLRIGVACSKEHSASRGCQKWRPSLPTIQELENY